jgi:hopene-associated glycosyltransferase HpnB
MLDVVVAAVCLVVWAWLITARGRFWTAGVRDEARLPAPAKWPSVAAVIPARNEADFIGESVGSLLAKYYAGPLAVIVVDDDSNDDTAARARAAARAMAPPLMVLTGEGPPPGWTGKLWAMNQGIDAAARLPTQPEFILLTDADIVHAPDSLSSLVARACASGTVLTSLMAKLRCETFAERSHVPAFVYFFEMLFPFRWVNRADTGTAAAAGGCMLVRAEALRAIGGIASVRNALIDDCALARKLKAVGPIWLGLTDRVRSLRPYAGLAEVRQMVSRSAYAQLGYSPLLLAVTTVGMALVFLAPPLLALFADGLARWFGLAAWTLMALSFQPMLRFYRLSPLWGIALPAIALAYMFYTLDSAYRHLRRRGGEWKGRVHVNAPGLP